MAPRKIRMAAPIPERRPPVDSSGHDAGGRPEMDDALHDAGGWPPVDSSGHDAGGRPEMDHALHDAGGRPEMDHALHDAGGRPEMDDALHDAEGRPEMNHALHDAGGRPEMDHALHDAGSRPEADTVLHDDRHWMRRALELAARASCEGEVPVGAVVVRGGVEIGAGTNAPIGDADPTAHAEIRALRAASRAAGNYRLPGATLYATMEPCVMCAGAIVHARVGRVVYGAADERWGGAGSVFDVLGCARLNHRPVVRGGVLAEESARLLLDFFRARRRPSDTGADPAGGARRPRTAGRRGNGSLPDDGR